MEHLYTVGFLVQRRERGVIVSSISTGLIKAVSDDEAIGKAYRVCRKVYPTNDGYYNHNCSLACITKSEVTKELAKFLQESEIIIDTWHEAVE